MPVAICQEDYDELKRQLEAAEADGERFCAEIKRLRAREKLLVDVVEEAGGLIETIVNHGVHYNWNRTAAAIRRLNESTGEQSAAPKGPAGDAGQVGWMGGEHDR